MQRWIKDLIDAYPQQGKLAERPWWSVVPAPEAEDAAKIGWRRSDGWLIYEDMRSWMGAKPNEKPERIRPKNTPKEAVAAWVDQAAPLDFPGFRAAQVWAFYEGAGSERLRVLSLTEHQIMALEHEHHFCVLEMPQAEGLHGQVYRPKVSKFTVPLAMYSSEMGIRLRRFGYLLADPCCPHLAPWAGAGK